MKKIKDFVCEAILLSIILVFTATVFAQKKPRHTPTPVNVEKVVNSQNYIFVPESLSPPSGGYRQLTPEYSVDISKDTVKSNLPYFGRAYSAPINPEDAGFEFTSTKFEYNVSISKKQTWDVTVKFKDQFDAQRFTLTIFEDGSATLQALSNNKQPISYHGYIMDRPGLK